MRLLEGEYYSQPCRDMDVVLAIDIIEKYCNNFCFDVGTCVVPGVSVVPVPVPVPGTGMCVCRFFKQ